MDYFDPIHHCCQWPRPGTGLCWVWHSGYNIPHLALYTAGKTCSASEVGEYARVHTCHRTWENIKFHDLSFEKYFVIPLPCWHSWQLHRFPGIVNSLDIGVSYSTVRRNVQIMRFNTVEVRWMARSPWYVQVQLCHTGVVFPVRISVAGPGTGHSVVIWQLPHLLPLLVTRQAGVSHQRMSPTRHTWHNVMVLRVDTQISRAEWGNWTGGIGARSRAT